MTDEIKEHLQRAKEMAIGLAAWVTPLILGAIGYFTVQLSDHSNRLSTLERGEIETVRRQDRTEALLIRIEDKIDALKKP